MKKDEKKRSRNRKLYTHAQYGKGLRFPYYIRITREVSAKIRQSVLYRLKPGQPHEKRQQQQLIVFAKNFGSGN